MPSAGAGEGDRVPHLCREARPAARGSVYQPANPPARQPAVPVFRKLAQRDLCVEKQQKIFFERRKNSNINQMELATTDQREGNWGLQTQPSKCNRDIFTGASDAAQQVQPRYLHGGFRRSPASATEISSRSMPVGAPVITSSWSSTECPEWLRRSRERLKLAAVQLKRTERNLLQSYVGMVRSTRALRKAMARATRCKF
jgi:hypothetical protein